MGTQKMTTKMIFASILFAIVSVVVVSESNAMPANHKLAKLEAQDGCAECQAAVYRDDGLEKTRSELLHLTGLISADGRDPRVEQKQDGSDRMFMPIGQVTSVNELPAGRNSKTGKPGRSLATAFLVSPCLIMTNQHVAYHDIAEPTGDSEKYRMKFEVGVPGKPGYVSAGAKPVAHGDFGPTYQITQDWTLLRLDADTKTGKCLGDQLGWLNLSTKPIQTYMGAPFISAGYPGDKKLSTLMVQKHCEIIPTQDLTSDLETTCASLAGNSGGPIMSLVPGSAPIVVAITSGTADYSSVVQKSMSQKNVNIAFDIYSSLRRRKLIDEDLAGKHNPLDSSGL